MNNSKQDILNNLIKEPFINQRILAAQTGHSLGIVNRSIKELISEGYLDEEIRPTEKTLREAKEKAPKNAIILAAGFGMRMVPINTETPKGLLEIKGERLIERTIRQLHEVGITEIYVVVGFMKEQYDIKKGMSKAQTEEQLAVQTGYWHCFRFNPALAAEGKSAFTLDSKAPSGDYQEFLNGEVRYNSLKRANPAKAERLFGKNEQEAKDRYTYLNKLVKLYGAEEE